MAQYKLGLKFSPRNEYNTLEKCIIDEASLPAAGLPDIIDYSYAIKINNQMSLGTCVAFSSARIFQFYRNKRHSANDAISAKAIYASAKKQFFSNDSQDDGLSVASGLSILKQFYCLESDYPSTPDDNESDFPAYLVEAPKDKRKVDFLIKNITTVAPDVYSMQKNLYKNGPFVIGISWSQNWFAVDPTTGFLEPPTQDAGGHCVGITGMNSKIPCPDGSMGAFIIANNWGTEWAKNGFCYLPFSYEKKYSEFWPSEIFNITVG